MQPVCRALRPAVSLLIASALPLATRSSSASVIALGVSIQMLIQPFVWRHWQWDELPFSWLALIGHRLPVALAHRLNARAGLASLRAFAADLPSLRFVAIAPPL